MVQCGRNRFGQEGRVGDARTAGGVGEPAAFGGSPAGRVREDGTGGRAAVVRGAGLGVHAAQDRGGQFRGGHGPAAQEYGGLAGQGPLGGAFGLVGMVRGALLRGPAGEEGAAVVQADEGGKAAAVLDFQGAGSDAPDGGLVPERGRRGETGAEVDGERPLPLPSPRTGGALAVGHDSPWVTSSRSLARHTPHREHHGGPPAASRTGQVR